MMLRARVLLLIVTTFIQGDFLTNSSGQVPSAEDRRLSLNFKRVINY